jgi:hypothetical protein
MTKGGLMLGVEMNMGNVEKSQKGRRTAAKC